MLFIEKVPTFKISFARVQDIIKCFVPFLCIIVAYGSFKFIMPDLFARVHYVLMPHFDKAVFGTLPTITMQHWLWHGYVTWYDYIFYAVYAGHYVLVVFLALLVYIKFRPEYFRFAMTYFFASFTGFIVFILYPTSPPWLASQNGYIPHITRVATEVFSSLGVQNFSHLYNSYAPDPIAAVPSLHTTYALLFVLFAFRLLDKKWAILSLLYPFCIIFGVVYMGEHYVFDVITGFILAFAAYFSTPVIMKYFMRYYSKLLIKLSFSYPRNKG